MGSDFVQHQRRPGRPLRDHAVRSEQKQRILEHRGTAHRHSGRTGDHHQRHMRLRGRNTHRIRMLAGPSPRGSSCIQLLHHLSVSLARQRCGAHPGGVERSRRRRLSAPGRMAPGLHFPSAMWTAEAAMAAIRLEVILRRDFGNNRRHKHYDLIFI